MSSSESAAPSSGLSKQDVNPWLIAVVVSLAAFMEVLDTSIANVALPHIAGDLGASNDESTWVLTSYLVSNAIVLPISGWFVGMLGRKRFFMMCILLFTASSLLCGVAWSLGFLLLARIIQGAGGGGFGGAGAHSHREDDRILFGGGLVCAIWRDRARQRDRDWKF